MMSIMLGHDLILAGAAQTVIAGGMEFMSNAPFLLANARTGYRLGHGRLIDHMLLDGLEDAYEGGGPWEIVRYCRPPLTLRDLHEPEAA